MVRFLQLIFLFLTLVPCSKIIAQNDRVKFSKVQEQFIIEKTVPQNIPEKSDYPVNTIANKNNITQLISSIPDSIRNNDKKLKGNTDFNSADKKVVSDNVTYVKEILPASEQTTSVEKPMVKVTQSVNYKPRMVKEDIHPSVDYSTGVISSDKRIYLEQEAIDLEREILQNAGKSDYDLVQKKKQLDDIRKMLQ